MPNVLVRLSDIAAALAVIFEPKIIPQFNRSVVLAQLLPYEVGTAAQVNWDAEFGTENVDTSVADGADIVDFDDDTPVKASLLYATAQQSFKVTGKARAGAAITGNPAQLEDLFGEKLMGAATRLISGINRDLYTGDGSADHLWGLYPAGVKAIGATGNYAGIDRNTYPRWAGVVRANGGNARPVTLQLMREMRQAIYESCGQSTDLIICSPTQHTKFGQLLGDGRHFIQDVYMRGQKIVLDPGYQALMFDGIPVIQDVACPNGIQIWINTNFVRLRQMPDAADIVNGSPGIMRLQGTPEMQFGEQMTGFYARINPLAKLGDHIKMQLILYPAIQVKRPNAQGVLADLA